MAEDISKTIPKEMCLKVVIAENLKSIRTMRGLTQEQLAELTGINRVTIAKCENHKFTITLRNLLKIAKALNVTPNAILKGWENVI